MTGGAADPVAGAPRIHPDAFILSLAAIQHGVVTRRQLLQAGIRSRSLDHRVKKGWLRRLHLGVYQVGPVRDPHARDMAAVLACGKHAALSHRSASALWRLTAPPGPGDRVDVTVRRGEHRRRAGIRAHRPLGLRADEVTELVGIPVTTAARTLLDLASSEPAKLVERALTEALLHAVATREQLAGLLVRYSRRSGVSLLRQLLDAESHRGSIRSDAEALLHQLIAAARLPLPETNARVEGSERDFVWRTKRLVVEVDGFHFHSGRARFESDRRRDAELVAAGFRVLRVTWRQMEQEPRAVIASIAQALAR